MQTNNTAKTFVIDHPIDQEKYLVHACLEGPEAGVYYRGRAEICDDQTKSVTINLPSYASILATDFTISLTQIYDGRTTLLTTTDVVNNSFTVYGDCCEFFWIVYGKRASIDVEPLKDSVTVQGDGPYKYI
jgi:hypothetical protein